MTKIEIFSKIWLKLKFSENLSKIGIFRNFPKFWTKSNFLQKFVQNRNCFENLTKIEIFWKFYLNRNFTKFSKKSKFFENFDQNQNCFENFDQSRNFFENLTKIEIFRKFWPKSKFLRKFDRLKSKFFGNLT